MHSVASNNPAASDSEDEDYVPPAHEQDSDEEENINEEVVTAPQSLVETEPEDKKRKREALWAEFQASISSSKPPEDPVHLPRMVQIEKKYRFAGDEVVEVVEVPENSPEAQQWPLWKGPNSDSHPISHPESSLDVPNETTASDAVQSVDPTTDPGKRSEPSSSVVPKPGPPKRSGPRKPKTILAPLPSSKAKKLTTLDKSAMDWRAHIQDEQEVGSSLKDELEAHRRTGGYLEKVEFLKRVEDRKEENLDAMKSGKRRKL